MSRASLFLALASMAGVLMPPPRRRARPEAPSAADPVLEVQRARDDILAGAPMELVCSADVAEQMIAGAPITEERRAELQGQLRRGLAGLDAAPATVKGPPRLTRRQRKAARTKGGR